MPHHNGAAIFACVLLTSRYYFSGKFKQGSFETMSNTIILIVLAVIVLIVAVAFIILSVQKSDADGAKTEGPG